MTVSLCLSFLGLTELFESMGLSNLKHLQSLLLKIFFSFSLSFLSKEVELHICYLVLSDMSLMSFIFLSGLCSLVLYFS